MQTTNKKKTGRAGFTLIELIVTIAILAILAGVGTVSYAAYVERSNRAADEQLIANIERALILGAYSGQYEPGTVVGAVGLSRSNAAGAAVVDGGNAAQLGQIMVNALGAGWEGESKLQSDHFVNTDSAKLIETIKNSQQSGATIFQSVPDSSFYKAEGNTDSIVADVDGIASALNSVLDGYQGSFGTFWGDDFRDAADAELNWSKDSGMTEEEKAQADQMAANLTVFAAANEIKKRYEQDPTAVDPSSSMAKWKNTWTSGGAVTIGSAKGYVADLVMEYARCVAVYNYCMGLGDPDDMYMADLIYGVLKTDMDALAETNQYLVQFNVAIDKFWSSYGNTMERQRTAWQSNGQAQKDFDAFIASMTAVNALEEDYVSADQADLLSSANAFEKAGAADILDTMVSYSKMGDLGTLGEYIIVLSIANDGTPVVTPTLQQK